MIEVVHDGQDGYGVHPALRYDAPALVEDGCHDGAIEDPPGHCRGIVSQQQVQAPGTEDDDSQGRCVQACGHHKVLPQAITSITEISSCDDGAHGAQTLQAHSNTACHACQKPMVLHGMMADRVEGYPAQSQHAKAQWAEREQSAELMISTEVDDL